MVTPTELATELGIPVKTLAEWRSRAIGPAYVKVGRHVRYRREAIDEWEAQQTRQPDPASLPAWMIRAMGDQEPGGLDTTAAGWSWAEPHERGDHSACSRNCEATL
jgi:predicted DNA-binding transcriptional regulator AlpA